MTKTEDRTWPLEHNSKYRMVNTHSPDRCEGEVCVLHNMTDHPMRDFPQHWRGDRYLMERICPHGVGHPDPDQWDFFVAARGEKWASAEFIHGCDGCCRATPEAIALAEANYG